MALEIKEKFFRFARHLVGSVVLGLLLVGGLIFQYRNLYPSCTQIVDMNDQTKSLYHTAYTLELWEGCNNCRIGLGVLPGLMEMKIAFETTSNVHIQIINGLEFMNVTKAPVLRTCEVLTQFYTPKQTYSLPIQPESSAIYLVVSNYYTEELELKFRVETSDFLDEITLMESWEFKKMLKIIFPYSILLAVCVGLFVLAVIYSFVKNGCELSQITGRRDRDEDSISIPNYPTRTVELVELDDPYASQSIPDLPPAYDDMEKYERYDPEISSQSSADITTSEIPPPYSSVQ